MQDKSEEIRFFSEYTQQKEYDVFTEAGWRRIFTAFQLNLQSVNVSRICDLGCGTGRFTRFFVKDGIEVHGLDICDRAISRASELNPGIQFTVGDIEYLPYEDNYFDSVILSGVLHHFSDPSIALGECLRVLRPGGILLAFDPHRHNPIMWLYRVKQSPFYSSVGVTANEQPLSKRHIRRHLQDAGFNPIDVKSISGITYKFVDGKFASLILPAYNLIETCLNIPPLRQYIGSFLITCAGKPDTKNGH